MLKQEVQRNIFANYSSTISTPNLIEIKPNLVMASFELMKLIPAKYVIMKGLADNKIDPTIPIVETSSGTYALGLGIVCAELNIPFFIISDSVIDVNLKNRLIQLGGKVQIIEAKEGGIDIQTLRIKSLNEYLEKNRKAFWPCQYNNPDNREAYNEFGDYLLDHLGSNVILVGAVGSGGSTCGTIKRMRLANKNIALIGVDTFGSILFGLPKSTRILRGLGNSIMPNNLIHEYFDQVHWLDAECAFKSTRMLHASKGLFCGPTTGATYQVAKWVANNNNDKTVIFISADTGQRYQSTVYNDKWLKLNNMNIDKDFDEPQSAESLKEVKIPWSYFNWGRKAYSEVIKEQL